MKVSLDKDQFTALVTGEVITVEVERASDDPLLVYTTEKVKIALQDIGVTVMMDALLDQFNVQLMEKS